jgi:3-methyladenine DNA glycosylase/8-oxoguanine DNA glycosylase
VSEIVVEVPGGFRFQPTVESHGWYILAPFRWDRTTRTLHRPETLDGETVDLEIGFDAGAGLRVRTGRLSRRREAELRRRLHRMFQLGVDLAEFHRLCAESESHVEIGRAGFGRLLCGSTLFEDVVKIIATTNTTWRQTVRMVRLLVDVAGRRSPSEEAAFPTPEEVAAVSAAQLREVCRMGYRADFVAKLARDIVEGAIDLQTLSDPRQPTTELFRSYRSLPGIGPYGAAHLLAMDGRHDFIAVDTEFRKFVRERYHGGRRVGDPTMLRRYAKWERWKYLAYWSELWEACGGSVDADGWPRQQAPETSSEEY